MAPGIHTQRLSDSDAKNSIGLGGASLKDEPAKAVSAGLPLWTYQVKSSKNNETYTGQIVGTNPGGPSIAIDGWFSDNNTFKVQAATCPPGGV